VSVTIYKNIREVSVTIENMKEVSVI